MILHDYFIEGYEFILHERYFFNTNKLQHIKEWILIYYNFLNT